MVRTDLPVGAIAAQLVHAAGESSPGNLDSGTYAIVLGVHSEFALQKCADRLRAASIEFVEIREPDEPYNGELMAIGVRPALRSVLRKHLSELPSFKRSTFTPESAKIKPAQANGGSYPPSGSIMSESSK